MAKSQASMLVDSINRARKEGMEMRLVVSGSPIKKAYVVLHNETAYNVEVINNQIKSCDCPHHVYRKAICKHMIHVSMSKGFDIAEPAE